MKIAWTTTETLAQAKILAKQVIQARLAACSQISSPITSIYHWDGKIQESTEFRITFKLQKSTQLALKQLVLKEHPYDTPQWVVADLSEVSEEYQAWVESETS